MKLGIPKGLLYSKYHVFAETFFEELGAQTVVSPDTNKSILNSGIKYCVDDACLPIKVFHGHVSWLVGKCDLLLVPRFISIEKKRVTCPMFCGLNEMLINSITDIPYMISEPVYCLQKNELLIWANKAARVITNNKSKIRRAFEMAVSKQKAEKSGFDDCGFKFKVALIGHIYNINDTYINMGLVNKLNQIGIGIITSDQIKKDDIESEVGALFKQPFWYFARQYYGAAVHLFKSGKIDGIIYVSAFSCGVDSVVIELIRDTVHELPFLLLKIDEHTGEAGLNTRIEAFADMLKWRDIIVNNGPKDGKYLPCRKDAV